MQRELPCGVWLPSTATATGSSGDLPTITGKSNSNSVTSVEKQVSENAVIVFGRRGCCMCHVVKSLLLGLGVNPTIFDVDEKDEAAVIGELLRIIGDDGKGNDGRLKFPAVFVGGKLFGGIERVMATHISGELVPILKEAGALWL
ncbi:unnamed protein product [Ilex paraguariensis]|uniref:Glutaredoxin domain-containing protein n=1 Tax=Ilex paraguariensis TaxID=185542 RepID=A0ABC8SB63_9AQUA